MQVSTRMRQLGIELPAAPAAAGCYVPCRRQGALIFVSGQLAMDAAGPITGRLGEDLDIAAGRAAARAAGLLLLAQLDEQGGGIDAVGGCLQLTGFVRATPDFTDHAAVVNGASELMVEVFGESGRHARAAVGMASLPFAVAVEVAGIFHAA